MHGSFILFPFPSRAAKKKKDNEDFSMHAKVTVLEKLVGAAVRPSGSGPLCLLFVICRGGMNTYINISINNNVYMCKHTADGGEAPHGRPDH